MPIIIGVFCVLPLVVGLIAQYLVCRFPKRKLWRALPPLVILILAGWVTAGRLSVWEADHSPVTQLLFVPGPAPPCLPSLARYWAGGCGKNCGAPG